MVTSFTRCVAAPTLFALSTGAGFAQSFDDTCRALLSEYPISVLVGNSPGGGFDTYARTFAPFLTDLVGQNVRVENMPGGGGVLAATAVAQQDDNEILILLDDMTDTVGFTFQANTGLSIEDFVPLGSMLSEPRAWFGRTGLDLNGDLVAGSGSLESSIVDTQMAAFAAGLNVEVIAGYSGSSDQMAAILRGETDFHAPSLGTGLRNSANEGLDILMVLSDEPARRAPDVPTLGDLVRAAGDDGDMDLAQVVINLTFHNRALLTAGSVDSDIVDCLRSATDEILASPEFFEAADAQGRLVDPLMHDATMAAFDGMVDAWSTYEDALEKIAE